MGAWLQDHVVRLCVNLYETAKLPSMLALPLCAPMTMSGSSRFSTSFQHLVLSLSWVLDSLICIYRSISLVLFLGIGSLHPHSKGLLSEVSPGCQGRDHHYSWRVLTREDLTLVLSWQQEQALWPGLGFGLFECRWWLSLFYIGWGLISVFWDWLALKKSFQRKWRGKGPGTSIPVCSTALYIQRFYSVWENQNSCLKVLHVGELKIFNKNTTKISFFVFVFWDRVFLCSTACSRTLYIGEAGFKLTEIYLSLPPECWDWRQDPPCLALNTASVKHLYLMFLTLLIMNWNKEQI